MSICPKRIILRRAQGSGSDRLKIDPTDDSIASIRAVVTHVNEPVLITLLGFHTRRRAYCAEYRIEEAVKRACDMTVDYVHFCILMEGYPADESEYLVAFLPRFKPSSELQKLTNEFCYIAKWLEIKRKINCLVFRYGPPVHGTENIMHWQKRFQRILKETRDSYVAPFQVEGRAREVLTSLVEKNMTISKNLPFKCINVS